MSESATTRFTRLRELFAMACELPEAERHAYLRDACAGDRDLFEQVQSLLGQEESAERWIPEAVERARSTLPDGTGRSGQRLGPYVLIRELGRGGMGSVWLAERSDDQYRKQVAIKLVKPGMDSEEILARFRAERQILASLEHPNIARLVDAGATPEGLPFLVMDYVEGKPLVEYATERRLDVRVRLRIFLDLSSAVEYAHQRMVVHRDLKSSNILVAADGVPKLLDFGIAKVIDPSQSGERTATMARLLTPDYASPEQVRGLPVTASSDVYSLGIVLFELLTGSRPYQFETLSPLEIDRVVCETDAPALSQRAPQPLRRRLEGDLDKITAKALDKDPAQRYASVAAMRDDIERHLAGKPVRARPATLRYRAGKFVRRNRLAVGLSAVVAASLCVGIASTLWQARRAEQRFQEVRKLAHTFVFDIHDLVAPLPGSTPARERIVQTALEYLDNLSREASGDPGLSLEVASAYLKVGNALGEALNPNLGKYDDARRSYQRAQEILTNLTRRNQGGTEAWRLLASCLLQQALLSAFHFGQFAQADELARRGLDAFSHLPAVASDADFEIGLRLRWFFSENAFIPGKLSEGFDWLRQLQAFIEQRGPRQSPTLTRFWLGVVHANSAKYLAYAGRIDEAVQHARQAVELHRSLAKDFPENALYAREAGIGLLFACRVLGDPMWLSAESPAEARPFCEESVQRFTAILDRDPKNVRAGADLREAQAVFASVLREQDPLAAVKRFQIALTTGKPMSAFVGLAWSLTRLARFSEAAQALDQARTKQDDDAEGKLSVQPAHIQVLQRLYAGDRALRMGAPDSARAAYADAQARAERAVHRLPEVRVFSWDLAEAYSGLAAAELARSNRAAAGLAAQKSLAIWESWQPDSGFRRRHLDNASKLCTHVAAR